MQVIFQNHIAIQLETAIPLQKTPGIQYHPHRFWPGKKRQPLVYGCRHKMRIGIIQHPITASGHFGSFNKHNES